jgi:hypothetical protein
LGLAAGNLEGTRVAAEFIAGRLMKRLGSGLGETVDMIVKKVTELRLI